MTTPFRSGSLTSQSSNSHNKPDLQLLKTTGRKKRIGFIVCDAGGGHKAAARALSDALHLHYPNQYETITNCAEDMIGPLGQMFGKFYCGAYNLALQGGHYWLEPLIFNSLTLSRTTLLPLGIAHYRQALKEMNPDLLVILIHGSHDVLHAAMEGNDYIPNITVVTDAASIREAWVHPKCDQVIVSTQEAQQACLALGMPADKIQIIGHPLDTGFAQTPRSQSDIRRRYFLNQDRFTIMMMMGGTGGRNIYRFSKALVKANLPVQIIACCGSDQRLFYKMQALAQQTDLPIKPFGYTTEIANLMAASDLLISKPGPGTIMEALARELPMIIDDSNYTMWQEKGNVDYVRKNNLGRVIEHTRELIPVVQDILNFPDHYQAMKSAVKAHKCPDASAQIAAYIHQKLNPADQADVDNQS